MGEFAIRLCRAHSCLVRIEMARYFCPGHWKLVPYALQCEIADAWSAGDDKVIEAFVRRAKDAISSAVKKGARLSR